MTPGATRRILTADNRYDGYMYVFGKGKSQQLWLHRKVLNSGQSVMLTGTIMDLSPGQPPTPCVSEESMTQWMESLHMQHAIPSDVVGVTVSLDAVDPNGNAIHIGEVVSDMSGSFKKLWTPDIVGEYTVTATFMGSNAYGSSWAETAIGVVETSPSPTPSTVAASEAPIELYFAISTAAIIIAIAVAALLLRRRP